MTGYTVHTGASKKFVAGWDNVFGGAGQESRATDGKKKSADKMKVEKKPKKKKK